ncbi:TKL protein kinase [Fonticula alba]|uniref:TKL protein kinase n=1 Tax=Fonticula alba TaxID=691883 RepID=A0A058Z8F4_FONAL|nr:TKL protein kinase [Fonticula alba]KCV70203.1 TKL protein kinase [Fonticula alba]|eukprot:XP_009495809.1 TKL protein kinase [Fonticula alba]
MLLHCPPRGLACRPGPRRVLAYPDPNMSTHYRALSVVQLPASEPASSNSRGLSVPQLPALEHPPAGPPLAASLLVVAPSSSTGAFLLQVSSDDCPLGTYGPECLPCSEDCLACSGPAPGECTAPRCAHYLPSDPLTCLAACPAGLHADANGACGCHADCAACLATPAGDEFLCTACPPGMALDTTGSSADRCGPCHASCQQCSAPNSPTACLACSNPMALWRPNGTCSTDSCPAGTWPNRPAGVCAPCSGNCAHCDDASRCGSCAEGFLLESTMGVCFECAENCAACARAPDRCTACPSGRLLLLDSEKCVTTCPPGTWVDLVRSACSNCHSSCAECEHSGEAGACTACRPGQVLHVTGHCVKECPKGFRLEAGACIACEPNCEECSAAGACDKCKSEHFQADDGSCFTCHSSCRTCAQADACATCRSGMVFLQSDPSVASLCGSTCAPGEYIGTDRCTPCAEACAMCAGPGAGACQVCATGYRWAEAAPANNKTGTCVECPPGCTSCNQDNECLECATGLFLDREGNCSAACQPGHYPTVESCQPCDVSCAECAGPSASDCTICAEGLDLVVSGNSIGTCSSGCPEGQYRDSTTASCRPCHEACVSCGGPSERDCWRCRDALLQGDQCLEACLPGHVALDDRCMACHASCSMCTGVRSTDCIGCPGGLLRFPAGESPSRCVSSCPIGHGIFDGGCTKCGDRCASCPGSSAECAQCERGALLFQAECRDSCPPGTLAVGGVCSECHHSCDSCFGTGDNHCLTCKESSPMQMDGVCHATCPEGTYPSANVCIPCHHTCASCSGPNPNMCTACHSDRLLGLDQTCIEACPSGQYVKDAPATGPSCQMCSGECRQCNGPQPDDCTACPEGYFLEGGRCVGTCSPRYFACTPENMCVACPADCTGCVHTFDSSAPCAVRCTSCEEGFLLSAATELCVAACPAGEFPDLQAAAPPTKCTSCDASCGTCHDRPAKCTSCANSSRWLRATTGECSTICPGLRFAESPVERVCLACPEHCLQCAAGPDTARCTLAADGQLNCPTVDSCTHCAPGYFLLDGQSCVSKCPVGFFDDWDSSPHVCGVCHASCPICTGPNKSDCFGPGSGGSSNNRRLALGLGIGLGLLFLLLLLALALFLLLRSRKTHSMKDPYSSSDEDCTVLNTIVELSLPGAIQVNLAADFVPINETLGTGAQATVFVARAVGAGISTRLGCPDTVAIKQLKAAKIKPRHMALFQNEIALMWLLRDHENIAQLYGYSEAPPAIVMERFDTDLGTLLHSEVGLSLHARLDLVQQWVLGLEAMHANGVAHCDLKPANVFVSQRPDGSWRAALGDLGTSRNLNGDRASALMAEAPELNAMSARYAGPEVLVAFSRRTSVEAPLYMPADMYAAAIMLWECLSRALPWEGCSFDQILESVTAGRRPEMSPASDPVARASPAFAQRLRDLLPQLWAHDAHTRPPASSLRQSVADLVAMLPNARS